MRINLKKQKGFTLVELLVTITILGIITALALPAVSRLQESNRETKYKTYESSMLSSAKLYIDSYSKDIFGNNNSGCYDVPYKDMEDTLLLKDFNESGVTCNDSQTFVRVYKINDEYRYEDSILCKKDGEEVYSNSTLQFDVCDNTADTIGPEIEISPNGTSGWKKSVDVTIAVRDAYGLYENISYKYGWTTDPSVKPSSYKTKTFTNKRGKDIELTFEVSTPKNASGTYYLVIVPINVRDVFGNYTSDTVISKEFLLDNSVPTIPTSEVRINNSNGALHDHTNSSTWTKENLWWGNFNSTDTGSGIDYYQYSTNCSGSATNKLNSSYTYSSSVNYKFCIRAVDKLGNKSDWSAAYYIKVDKDFPTCSSSGGNPDWTNVGRTLVGTCSDTGGSGCTGNTSPWVIDWEGDWKNLSPGSVCDAAGNCTVCPANQTVRVDKTDPTCSLSVSGTSGNNGWYKSNVTVTLNRNDAMSGVFAYGISAVGYTTNNTSNPEGKREQTTETSGTKWYGQVVDKAGNVQTCTTTVKIDKTPPTCGKITGGSKTWAKKRTLSIKCSDSTSGCVANPSSITYNSSNLSQSMKTLKPIIYDKAGNSRECSSTNIYVDIAPPTVKFSPQRNKLCDGGATYSYRATMEITDDSDDVAGSGYKNFYSHNIKVAGVKITDRKFSRNDCPGGTLCREGFCSNNSATGTYTNVQITDAAGNTTYLENIDFKYTGRAIGKEVTYKVPKVIYTDADKVLTCSQAKTKLEANGFKVTKKGSGKASSVAPKQNSYQPFGTTITLTCK